MSIIAIQGIPQKWSLVQVMKTFAPIVAGNFETLNFVGGPSKFVKTCYLRLSERLDPVQVVEKINLKPKQKNAHVRAIIPDRVPDFPLAAKAKQIPPKLARALRIPQEDSPDKVLFVTHSEILREMQYKFTGLFNLSRRTPGHKLLENIARTIFERLHSIMEGNDNCSSCFELSKLYRKLHPHFGDFQLILSTLHAIQDGKGAPRSQMTEDKLIVVNTEPCSMDNIPLSKINSATSKYSLAITKKILEHIRTLPEDGGPPEQGAARRRVRQELRNMAQHLPSIIRQVIQKHLAPPKSPFYRMRIYGEPYLPNKDQMAPLTRRHRAVKIVRSDRAYNLLRLSVPPEQFSSLMAMDGTVIGGAKLVIRASDISEYKVPKSLAEEMRARLGVDKVDYGDDEADASS